MKSIGGAFRNCYEFKIRYVICKILRRSESTDTDHRKNPMFFILNISNLNWNEMKKLDQTNAVQNTNAPKQENTWPATLKTMWLYTIQSMDCELETIFNQTVYLTTGKFNYQPSRFHPLHVIVPRHFLSADPIARSFIRRDINSLIPVYNTFELLNLS